MVYAKPEEVLMAHKTVTSAINDLKQQVIGYSALIVWRKDWERWRNELELAIDGRSYQLVVPLARTKNQVYVAERRSEIG